MRQYLNPKRVEILIVLLVMGVALWMSLFASVTLIFQFVPTCVMLFGILKAHQQHKSKFMLFWMLATTCLFCQLIIYSVIKWEYWDILNSIISISIMWLAAIAVLYMLTIMYNHYVELTLGPQEPAEPPKETEISKEQLAKLNGQV
ncbi:uncharacterized protein LOC111602352 [Drosophila hydei]|uniref:Uncharacterized protein LOC111602352 n=1 Tax=Drosophila hydei TaxID=7224 RepID=A0A6J1M563_DROHY|nr:uncharacterized protein LOC111602352 [Drosophila hydei]